MMADADGNLLEPEAAAPPAERLAQRLEAAPAVAVARPESKSHTASRVIAVLHEIAALDLAVYQAIATTSTPMIDDPIRRLSRLADRSKIWIGLAAVIGATGGRSGRRTAADGLAAVFVTSVVVNIPVKLVARRSRPRRDDAGVPLARHVPMPHTASFPSGHTASAFAFAAGVARTNPTIAIPLRLLASLVGYSRIHTGVHYPGDVIVGALIGATLGESTAHFTASRSARRSAAIEQDRDIDPAASK